MQKMFLFLFHKSVNPKIVFKTNFVTLKEFSVNLGSHDDIDNVRMYGKIISKYGPTSSLLSLEAK